MACSAAASAAFWCALAFATRAVVTTPTTTEIAPIIGIAAFIAVPRLATPVAAIFEEAPIAVIANEAVFSPATSLTIATSARPLTATVTATIAAANIPFTIGEPFIQSTTAVNAVNTFDIAGASIWPKLALSDFTDSCKPACTASSLIAAFSRVP